VLLARVDGLSEEELTLPYRTASGPLGDFCESRLDLVAHVLMWDEIGLAVLSEAAAGRAHWSLDPDWETPEAGRLLNRGGVAAGRYLPPLLLVRRLQAVHDAVLAEFGRYNERTWVRPGPAPLLAGGIGGLATRVWTVMYVVELPAFAPQTAAFLERIGSNPDPADVETLIAERAERTDPELSGRPDPAVESADIYLPVRHGPVLTRLYRVPGGGPRPLVLWLHGGGFIGGSVADIDHVCSRVARLAGVTVVSLEYRLAPEHPFPAALHDTYDAMRWLDRHGALIGGDGRVAAGGQSAGAALVAGACLLARDESGPVMARQVLCYPTLDFGRDTESCREFDGVFHSIGSGWSDAWYLAGQPVNQYAAPLRAQRVAGLPPALVIGAGRDPLRDDARDYAARLDEEGVEVTHVEYADTMHAFLNFCPVLSAGEHAIGLIAADLARVFGLPGEPDPR
jgi:acetyl esterase